MSDRSVMHAIAHWKQDPVKMVKDLFEVEPDEWQKDALRSFARGDPRIAMKACAGPGKTFCLAAIGWNFMLTRPHPAIGVTSITGDNLRANLWTELGRWYEKAPVLQKLFEFTKSEIYARDHPKTWKMEARSWAKDADANQIGNALRGLHSPYVMWLCDESGEYPNSILPVLENVFAGNPKEAHIVQCGNPSKLDGMLYRACVLARDLWTVIEITGDPDDPKRSPRISIEHAREQIKQYGRDNPWVMVNILGQFPPAAFNTLIGPDEVRASMARVYTEYDIQRAAKVMSLDVAREGDDQSVLAKRQGLQCFTMKKWRNLRGPDLATQVNREWGDWDADGCMVDMTGGFGTSPYDHLIILGRAPIAVDYSSSAHQAERYYNKRAEMAFETIEWVRRGGALPNDPRLEAAMTQTTYTFRGSRLLLEPKEMIKKRLGYSPDEFDAVMGTHAEPIQPRQQVRQRNPSRSAMPAEYNPFEGLENNAGGPYNPYGCGR